MPFSAPRAARTEGIVPVQNGGSVRFSYMRCGHQAVIYLVPAAPAADDRRSPLKEHRIACEATNADRAPGAGPAIPDPEVTFPNAGAVQHVKRAGSQSGMSSGLLTTTPKRSPIAARLAACSAAAGTGAPSGPGRSLVAVALATTVGW
jgi:hypothetical protein